MKRLEMHQQGLERYGNKFKFVGMAEKIEMLCEGISYLLFQRLLVGDRGGWAWLGGGFH